MGFALLTRLTEKDVKSALCARMAQLCEQKVRIIVVKLNRRRLGKLYIYFDIFVSMPDKTKEIVITAIVTLAIVVLVGGYIQDYLTLPEPVFYLENSCYYGFDKNKETSFSITLRNMGEVPALVTSCVSSKEFLFKSSDGEFHHTLCWNEDKVSPKQTELYARTYTIIAKPDANVFNSAENATILFDVSCKQKIWTIGSRKCMGATNICKYTKDNDGFRKMN